MKKIFYLACILVILISSGCTEKNDLAKDLITLDVQGNFVTKIENDRILVINTIPQNFTSTGGVNEYYSATWLYNLPKNDVKVGQKIKYTTQGFTLGSYPGAVEGKSISILLIERPVSARMTVEEVIRKTIDENTEIKVFVLKGITFDSSQQIWSIRFKEGFNFEKETKEFIHQVHDK